MTMLLHVAALASFVSWKNIGRRTANVYNLHIFILTKLYTLKYRYAHQTIELL